MRFKRYAPVPELADLVRTFWILEYKAETEDSMDYALFANGFPSLVFQYQGSTFKTKAEDGTYHTAPWSHYQGQTVNPLVMKSSGPFAIVGAYLYPRATQELFDLSAVQVTNATLDVQSLWGSQGDELEERIVQACSAQQRIKLLSDFLLTRLRRNWQLNSVIPEIVRKIFESRGGISIKGLADYSGYSLRQLERSFKSYTGLSPKHFARIARFHSSIDKYKSQRYTSLSALAYDSGYSDQAHFIRDFTEFSGISPRTYFKDLNEVANSFVQL